MASRPMTRSIERSKSSAACTTNHITYGLFIASQASTPSSTSGVRPSSTRSNYQHLPLLILHPQGDTKVDPHHAEDMYLETLKYDPDHVERVWFEGNHGDRIADHANYILGWLSQFEHSSEAVPQNLSYATDWSGSHFWMKTTYSSAALTEAHWVRVQDATFSPYRTARSMSISRTSCRKLGARATAVSSRPAISP